MKKTKKQSESDHPEKRGVGSLQLDNGLQATDDANSSE
jgi:hypothetical protein